MFSISIIAVKFGRMSKKQHDIIQAEVEKLRLREQRMDGSTNLQRTEPQVYQATSTSPQPGHTIPHSLWTGRWDTSCSARSCSAPRMQLQKDPLVHHSNTPEKTHSEAFLRKSYLREQQLHQEHPRPTVFQGAETYGNVISGCLLPECVISATELGESIGTGWRYNPCF